MNNKYVYELQEKLKISFGTDIARYWHTIAVANTSACLAMRYQVDAQKAYIAGLLHDCAKCMSDEALLAACNDNNIEVTEAEKVSPYLLHAKYGAFLARTLYDIQDEEIINAITYHTTGRPCMSPLEEIIYIADYIEPFRNKAANLGEIRSLVFVDIKKAISYMTKSTLDYLEKNSRPVDPLTIKTYEYYSKEDQNEI